MIGGVIFGMIVGDWAANLDFVGKIFIRLIQMSIVPLVLASIITATGSMSGSGMGRNSAFRAANFNIFSRQTHPYRD